MPERLLQVFQRERAVPVAAASTGGEFRDQVNEIVCAETPEPFQAVGQWYEDFSQTTDKEVRDLLRRARAADRPQETVRTVRPA
jgi:putative phosphoribosyl transferase